MKYSKSHTIINRTVKNGDEVGGRFLFKDIPP